MYENSTYINIEIIVTVIFDNIYVSVILCFEKNYQIYEKNVPNTFYFI